MNNIKTDPIDLIIIIVYIIGILFIGLWSVRKNKMTSDNYFLAGRGLKWLVVRAALFASYISTIHVVGLAASGYNDGLGWGNFEWMAVFTLILLGLIFAPFYIKTRIATLPEFLEQRYGSASRTFLAFMGILAALFVHMGMSLYVGAVVFESFFGISVIHSIIIISVVTTVYTVAGGLKALMVTESVQTIILIVGAVFVTLFGILALPEHGITTFAAFKAAAKEGQLSMLQTTASLKTLSETASSTGLTWYAVLLGYPVMGIWYWCTDQTHVQRVLSARSVDDAQKRSLFAGVLKILPVFLLVLPGVIGYVLFKDISGTDANQTFPVLIKELLPIGLKGIVTLGAGFLLGVISFCLDFVPISGKMFITDGLGIPFMMQAWWLFCICCVLYYAVSYATPKPNPAAIAESTWESPLAVITKDKLTGLFDNRLLAGYLLLTMVVLYTLFG